MGVLGYIGIVQHKKHSPEVLSIPPGTPVYVVRRVSFRYMKAGSGPELYCNILQLHVVTGLQLRSLLL